MIIGLEDFDIDIFLTFEDENIKVYYSDFASIPELANYIPLGSFTDGEFQFKKLNMEDRIQVGLLYMLRDLYAEKNVDTKQTYINVEIFMREFSNVPEVTNFFGTYQELCRRWGETDEFGHSTMYCPTTWLGWHDDWCLTNDQGTEDPMDDVHYIDWNVYPDWCSSCTELEEVPEWCSPCSDNNYRCMRQIPTDVIPPQDLYFIILIYFNGIYRTKPESVQNFGPYQVLTDIDFELNKYSMIVDIKEFFTKEFQWYLRTSPGMLPFGCDYGTHIKYAVQTKNDTLREIQVQNELQFFVVNFNRVWGDLVELENINIVVQETATGGDGWLVDVQANIKAERLVYRLEI